METDQPFSLRNCLKLLGLHFPLIFIWFLFLLGGVLSGAVYTQHRLLSPDQPLFAAQTPTLTDKVVTLPKVLEAMMAMGYSQATTKLNTLIKPSQTLSSGAAVSQPIKKTVAEVSPLPSGVDPLTAISVPTPKDHYRGNLDAKIVLIEYGDFECPYCGQFEPTMDQITQEYGDKIGRVWRHFPLAIHPHAEPAAEASECVTEQLGNEGFWKFNDSIFAQNAALGGSLTPEAITKAASDAGVEMSAFQTCLSSGEMAPVVQANQDEGLRASFGGTPSTVMIVGDGQRFLLSGAVSHDDLKKFIDSYL